MEFTDNTQQAHIYNWSVLITGSREDPHRIPVQSKSQACVSEEVALKMRIASCGECGRGEWEVSFLTGNSMHLRKWKKVRLLGCRWQGRELTPQGQDVELDSRSQGKPLEGYKYIEGHRDLERQRNTRKDAEDDLRDVWDVESAWVSGVRWRRTRGRFSVTSTASGDGVVGKESCSYTWGAEEEELWVGERRR